MKLSPIEAGIYLIPVSAALAVFRPNSGWLSDRYCSRFFSGFGLFLSGVGFRLLTQLQSKSSFTELILPFILLGAGMGIFASPNRAYIMNNVPANRRGISASTGTTLFYVGRSLSLGISFLIMTTILPSEQVKEILIDFRNTEINMVEDTTNAITTSANEKKLVEDKFLNSIHIIFFISSIIVFISIIPATVKDIKIKE